MALTDIQKLRIEVQDTAIEFPFLADEEYQYLLDKNNQSIKKASLEAARLILFKLSINASDETVSVFSIKGSQAAKAYMEALKLYITNQALNPLLMDGTVYAGGISKQDYEQNNSDSDNLVPDLKPQQQVENYNPFLL